jgi:hypothetical protein
LLREAALFLVVRSQDMDQESVAFLGFNPHSIERFPHEEHRHQEERDCQHVGEQRIVRSERHGKLDCK